MEHRKLRLVGAVFAALGVGVLAACGSASGHNVSGTPGVYGTQPAVGTGTEHRGTITFGYLSSYAPTEIVPIPTSAANSTYNEYQLNWQMYRPLYYAPDGYDATEWTGLSLADDPVYTDGDTTVSVTLKGTYKWSDGTPVTARDILFWYDLMKAGLAESPANWGDYAPGVGIPDEVSSVAVTGKDTIVFHLKKAVNPTWFTLDELGNIEPMPYHTLARASASGPVLDFTNPSSAKNIYNFLMNESKDYTSYATSPLWKVVDGPYALSAFNATSGTFTLTPNTAYSGPHATGGESAIEFVGFASESAEYLAIEAGQLDVTRVPDQDIPQSASLKSYYTFGAPQFGFDAMTLNFEDTTGDFNNIIAQLYIRQALEHLVDQPGYISAFVHGAGTQAYGVDPSFPANPYQPADARSNLYPFSTSAARSLLTSHGWRSVDGVDTCVNPGTGAHQCGSGIPKGTRLEWNMQGNTSVTLIDEEDTDFLSQAARVGIKITLRSETFNDLINNDNDIATPADKNTWAMSDFGSYVNSTYPTTLGLFNTGGVENLGGYSDPVADKLINTSVSGSAALAVKNEMSYLTQELPVIFQPLSDRVWVVSRDVSATDPRSFQSLTEADVQPEFWYLTK